MIKLLVFCSVVYFVAASFNREEITAIKTELDKELVNLEAKKETGGSNEIVSAIEGDVKKEATTETEDNLEETLLKLLKQDSTKPKQVKKDAAPATEGNLENVLVTLLKHGSTKPERDSSQKLLETVIRMDVADKKRDAEAGEKALLTAELNSMTKKEIEITRNLIEAFIFDGARKKKADMKERETSKKSDDLETRNKILQDLIDEVDLKKRDLMKNSVELTEKKADEKKEDYQVNSAATEELLRLYLKDAEEKEKCTDNVTYCHTMKSYCNTHEEVSKVKCRKTCGTCGTEEEKKLGSAKEEKEEVCEDKMSHCETLKERCTTHPLSMENLCAKTCKYCKVCNKDKWSNATCHKAKLLGYCNDNKYKEKLKENCFRSCGHCRAASPPACQMDPYGCCWDNVTFARNGCPACKDNDVVGMICQRFQDACSSDSSPGKFMKLNCPLTCHFCDPSKVCHGAECGKKNKAPCVDKIGLQDTCAKWKVRRKCMKLKKFTMQWCRRTCDFCV